VLKSSGVRVTWLRFLNGVPMKKYTMSLAGLLTTIAIIALGIIDLAFVLLNGTGSTVSTFMVNVGFASPMVVFAVGFVCGHLFGYMRPVDEEKKVGE